MVSVVDVILFVYGLAVGSFLNVLADRLSREQSILGRSYCEFCKKTLRWYDLIPVYSYISQKAKCRYCHKKLSPWYLVMELITGFVFVLAWQLAPFDTIALKLLSVALAACLLVILSADFKYHIIPDEMHVAIAGITLLILLILNVPPVGIAVRAIEGLLIMVPILFLFLITKGRGMGFGDVKLAFVIGFLLGAYRGALALYIAFLSGAVIGVVLLLSGKTKLKNRIAFGPFLVLGIICLFYFQNQVIFVVDKLFSSR